MGRGTPIEEDPPSNWTPSSPISIDNSIHSTEHSRVPNGYYDCEVAGATNQ